MTHPLGRFFGMVNVNWVMPRRAISLAVFLVHEGGHLLSDGKTNPVLADHVGASSHILNHVLPVPALVELALGDAADMYAEKY